MSTTSDQLSAEFLQIADQFKLGALITEASHPVTANLSDVARDDIASALKLLLDVDDDVLQAYRAFVGSGRAAGLVQIVLRALRVGGRMFFTGCGSTGRLSIQLVSIWRDYWQRKRIGGPADGEAAADFERRACAVMAGGDFALIKAVEGFEDFTEFGRRQLADHGVAAGDVVFAITEGGETSFVIGTAWEGVAVGARVVFVYNNPDQVLCQHVQRSREVIEDPRIEKLNLTTGPMSITGSTRMQATSIQLVVLLTVLEMVVRELEFSQVLGDRSAPDPAAAPAEFLATLEATLEALKSPAVLTQLTRLVELEEGVYRAGRMNNYFADGAAIDVLTDTTERSPTYCTPSFRKFDDVSAAESWAFLFVPEATTTGAWQRIIKRPPWCVEWSEAVARELVPAERLARTLETLERIGYSELMRFRVGLDGLAGRPAQVGGSAVGILSEREKSLVLEADGFVRRQLDAAREAGAKTGLIYLAEAAAIEQMRECLSAWDPECVSVLVPMPATDLLLDGMTRVGLKLILNTLSTCTMVRLGRVMGNYMIWVVPSNLKLVDRATRYIEQLTGLGYAQANRLLFEVIEYVEPRMTADQTYPPVVGLAVLRQRHGLTNVEAERQLMAGL